VFTQCPACETIFKISAEVLRAAAGEVRCGRCGEIFNALRSLAEEPRAFTTGESAREQEARADKILHNAGEAADLTPPPPVQLEEDEEDAAASAELEELARDGAPGTQIAQLEIQGAAEFLDVDDEQDEPAEHVTTRTIADDPSMEFTLPPGELDRIFVEARPHHFVRGRHNVLRDVNIDEIEPISPEQLGAAAPPPEEAKGEGVLELREDVSVGHSVDLSLDLAPQASGERAAVQAAPMTLISDAVDSSDSGHADVAEAAASPPAREVPDFLKSPPREASSDASPAPAAATRRGDWVEKVLPTRDIEEFAPAREPHSARWAAAAVLLVLLLALQLVHHHRDALAQSPAFGSALRSLYQIAGYPIPLKLNLGAFEVRQWGVTGDANANGTLRVRASLINTGASAQPYPLLRLTLADRFGTRLGTRDFLPSEYLRQPPVRPLDAGERADTLVEIVDPGKTAEGFEIDVCERQLDARVVCANDAHRSP
jgi:predicted Zn finger-like uncharacterized protein